MYVDDERPLKRDRNLINPKVVVRGAGGGWTVYLDSQARPFSRLNSASLLDTADLCLLFGCSTRTVYRWMADQNLKPEMRVGRQHLFTKREILDWYDKNRPRPGRPPISRR